MNYNQYEAYKENGQRREDQLELLKNPYIDIHELRRITNTLDEYERFDNFENWTLKKPIEEINNFTHFTVTYEKIKKGRSIIGIQFNIEKKSLVSSLLIY